MNEERMERIARVSVEGEDTTATSKSNAKTRFGLPTRAGLVNCFPIIETLRKYDPKDQLLGDVIAGITVGVMLVPQGMAYAMLANLPPQYGLYSAVVPIFVYAIFGTSQQLAVGPVAIMSLLVGDAIEAQKLDTLEEKVQLAHLIAFFVGILSLLLGVFKAGILSSFLSHSVLVGFTSGAAIVIGLSQLKHLLGIQIPKFHSPIMTLVHAFGHLDQVNVTTLIMGLIAIFIMIALRKAKQKWGKPIKFEVDSGRSQTSVQRENFFRRVLFFVASFSALEIVVLGTTVTYFLYESHGYTTKTLPIVGYVPSGFPPPSAPEFSLLHSVSLESIGVSSAMIALIGFLESFAVADSFARKLGYKVDANQELSALGLSNILGSFFSAYPVAGGFGRSAVNEAAGATSVVASMLSSVILFLVIMFMTSWFYYMPRTILAAIVLVAVSSLVDIGAMRLTWEVSRTDFFVIMVTFWSVLLLGTELGLAIGVLISILILLKRSAFPHIAVLGTVKSDQTGQLLHRNVKRFPSAYCEPALLKIRIDAPLDFSNVNFVVGRIADEVSRTDFTSEAATYHPAVLLFCEGINSIDVSGVDALYELKELLKSKRVSLVCITVKGPVRDVIGKKNAFLIKRGKAPFMPWLHHMASKPSFPSSFMVASLDDALAALQLDNTSSCQDHPLVML